MLQLARSAVLGRTELWVLNSRFSWWLCLPFVGYVYLISDAETLEIPYPEALDDTVALHIFIPFITSVTPSLGCISAPAWLA